MKKINTIQLTNLANRFCELSNQTMQLESDLGNNSIQNEVLVERLICLLDQISKTKRDAEQSLKPALLSISIKDALKKVDSSLGEAKDATLIFLNKSTTGNCDFYTISLKLTSLDISLASFSQRLTKEFKSKIFQSEFNSKEYYHYKERSICASSNNNFGPPFSLN